MNEQREWLEERVERIANIGTLAETTLVLQTTRKVCGNCLNGTLVAFVQRANEARYPRSLDWQAQVRTWAERVALEVIASRQEDWAPGLYLHSLDVLTVRGSSLLTLPESHIVSRKLLSLIILSASYGELLKVYGCEPDIFWSIRRKRKLALSHLAVRLPAYGAELN